MFKLREKLDRIMVAITFSEANEHDLAAEFMQERVQSEQQKRTEAQIQRRDESRPQLRT
jgi:hypothetical protein